MDIDRWLMLPSRLKWGRPDPEDYSDEDSLIEAQREWEREVEGYESACDRWCDEQKEKRYEQRD